MSRYKRRRLGDPETHIRDIFTRPNITKRDREILLAIYWHRCLTTHQIRDMFFSTLQQADVVCRRRLRVLFDNMLVTRFFPEVGEGEGSSPQHVMLDDLGAKVVAGLLGVPVSEIRWSREMNDKSLPFLQHIVEYNSYYTANLLHAREHEHEIPLFLAEHHLYHPFRYREKDYALNPDAYLQYWRDDTDGVAVFLEWDRGTMSPRQFQQKAERYNAFYASGEYRRREYEVFPTIVTIAPTWERCERLCRAIEEADTMRALRWLFATPDQMLGDGEFIEAWKKDPVTLFE